MKTDELRQIIRGIIREEMAKEIIKMKPIIKESVSKEVTKSMGKILAEVIKEIKTPKTVKVTQSEQLMEGIEDIPYATEMATETPTTPNMPILKTNNAKLNSVLAETARHFKPLPRTQDSSLVELMDGGFEKIGKHETITPGTPATKMDFLKQMVGPTPEPSTPSVLDHTDAVPDVLKNVFKRDFREVLAKSKEKNGMGASMRVGLM